MIVRELLNSSRLFSAVHAFISTKVEGNQVGCQETYYLVTYTSLSMAAFIAQQASRTGTVTFDLPMSNKTHLLLLSFSKFCFTHERYFFLCIEGF